tara:strand:- start:168 stop:434 length:267 start_codon:yes stop_codon:yes gene_type:complete
MKKDRKNMTIVRYGNSQDAPVLTYKTFQELKEQLIESLAWDNEEDERDYPLHTFSLRQLLNLGDYAIELDFTPGAYISRSELWGKMND